MRKKLISEIKKAFSGLGYNIYQGFIYRINEQPFVFPLTWINPPELVAKSGRNEGIYRYAVSFYMMAGTVDTQNIRTYTEDEKSDIWDKLESDAIAGLWRLPIIEEGFNIISIRTSPDEFSLTPQTEISLKVECVIELPWCNERDS